MMGDRGPCRAPSWSRSYGASWGRSAGQSGELDVGHHGERYGLGLEAILGQGDLHLTVRHDVYRCENLQVPGLSGSVTGDQYAPYVATATLAIAQGVNSLGIMKIP